MAESNEAPSKSSTKPADKNSQQNKIITEKPVTSCRSAKWALPLTMIMAAIALIVALYSNYTNNQAYHFSKQQMQDFKLAIDELKQQQSDTQTNLATIKAATSRTYSNLQSQMQKINNDLQTALQQHLDQKQDWLLLKARYYLELAQINAHWSEDQQVTISLLQQADDVLRTIPDEKLFTVRQAIAQEITQLQGHAKIDIAGLLSQLDAAQNVTANLPIKQPHSAQTINNETPKNLSPWRQKLQESLNVLEKLVVVRRNEEDIQPLISPLHQTLLRDSIRLNLQQAQWAILQNNPKIYDLSLTQALQTIKRSFDESEQSTQALIQQLQTLQQEKLVAAKPTIGQSLSLLNQLIEVKDSGDKKQ